MPRRPQRPGATSCSSSAPPSCPIGARCRKSCLSWRDVQAANIILKRNYIYLRIMFARRNPLVGGINDPLPKVICTACSNWDANRLPALPRRLGGTGEIDHQGRHRAACIRRAKAWRAAFWSWSRHAWPRLCPAPRDLHAMRVASGVTSRSDKPVPPQVITIWAPRKSAASMIASAIWFTSSRTTTWLATVQPQHG